MFKLALTACAAATVAALDVGCASTVPVTADSLVFAADAQWRREVPRHDTRKLQFSIPADREGVQDARLIVWNFPTMRDAGDGQTIQTNVRRWMAQFVQDDGSPSGSNAQRLEYRINDIPVHVIDISGRYIAETAEGSGVRLDLPGYRMLGAYINAPHGDYIVKLWGPAPVVADNLESFKTFVWSTRSGNSPWQPYPNDDGTPPRTTLTATKNAP